MDHYESFWVTVATVAPVIALGQVIAMSLLTRYHLLGSAKKLALGGTTDVRLVFIASSYVNYALQVAIMAVAWVHLAGPIADSLSERAAIIVVEALSLAILPAVVAAGGGVSRELARQEKQDAEETEG